MGKKNVVDSVVAADVMEVAEVVAPPAPRQMDQVDKLALDLAKANRKTALAEAQTALAKSENAELSYKYTVLQIYMKYGLTPNDAITEDGAILINGAVAVDQSKV